jgi:hypothetical protein
MAEGRLFKVMGVPVGVEVRLSAEEAAGAADKQQLVSALTSAVHLIPGGSAFVPLLKVAVFAGFWAFKRQAKKSEGRGVVVRYTQVLGLSFRDPANWGDGGPAVTSRGASRPRGGAGKSGGRKGGVDYTRGATWGGRTCPHCQTHYAAGVAWCEVCEVGL